MISWVCSHTSPIIGRAPNAISSPNHSQGPLTFSTWILFLLAKTVQGPPSLMNILDVVVGKPIKSCDERAEQIGPAQGIPIFGLDALSSAAYGPEAALSLLIPLGLLGVQYIIPISAAIITLLVIVYFSYRQTIAAYPSGGGSYTVARFNLGARAGLLAAAALLADYILTAAVGISAGVGALVSAVPSMMPHTVSLCVGILIVITILNLRGVREAGFAFAVPTYLFVGTLLITIVAGVLRVLLGGGHPTPAVPLPAPPPITEAVSYWLLLKVFASGCTALTGVEAVSNGVKAFRDPAVKNAQRTLTVIIFLLAVLLAGISYLVKVYGIAATDPGITVVVVLVAKFVEGAWITLLFIPLTIALFIAVRRHYHSVRVLTSCCIPVRVTSLSQPPIVVIPIDRWSNIARQGIEFAARLSTEVIAIHVEPTEHSELLEAEWEHYVERPFRAAGKEPPKLHFLPSPYRFVIVPTVQFILDVSNKNPARSIIVVIPELVENKWYEYFLHNQRGRLLEWVLLARGNERIFTVSAPWHIGERQGPA